MDNDATSTLTGTSAEDQAVINELLGGGAASEEETPSETEQKTGAHTEEVKTEPAKESEKAEEADRGTEEETEPEEKTEEEPEEEESELSIEDGDRDYSQAAYEKAAKHYSKTLGVQLNPDDPAHRALLKENMDRGEALKRLTAEAKAKTEEVKPAAEEEKPVEVQKATPEQIQSSLQEIREVAKSRLVPEVALSFATDLKTALAELLWEDEAPEKIAAPSQARANKVMVALHSLMLAALNDAAQPLFQMVNNNLAQDPVWGPARQEAIDARAFEHLDKTKGAEYYASLEALAENGTLKKVIADNPDIFKNIKAGNGRDPVLNRAAQLEAAFKIARGDQTIAQVTKAVETGKKQATTIAKKIASGRVSAGTPKSGFKTGKSAEDELVSSITSGGGSKFSQAVKSQLHR